MKSIMQAVFAIVLVFTVALPAGALAQVETEEKSETEIRKRLDFILSCASPAGYSECELRCRDEYEVCLRKAASNDENQCRGEFDNCMRICSLAHCEE